MTGRFSVFILPPRNKKPANDKDIYKRFNCQTVPATCVYRFTVDTFIIAVIFTLMNVVVFLLCVTEAGQALT